LQEISKFLAAAQRQADGDVKLAIRGHAINWREAGNARRPMPGDGLTAGCAGGVDGKGGDECEPKNNEWFHVKFSPVLQ
jgi:hypothetical protein